MGELGLHCLRHGQGPRESSVPNEPFFMPSQACHQSSPIPEEGEDGYQGLCRRVPSDAAPALAPVVSRDGQLCVKRVHLFFS